MIEFNAQIDFELPNSTSKKLWIESIVKAEKKNLGMINYVFCNDDFLYDLNVKYLGHDTLTDVISFDYGKGDEVSGEIYISIDRVKENAMLFNDTWHNELDRVMIHGVLHFMGYKDSTSKEKELMRAKEQEALSKR